MATLKEIRRRITSVKNTQKITKAMKLVSAAKFARANAAIRGASPYGKAIDRLLTEVARTTNLEEIPIFQARPENRILVITVTSDRGLCGALNTNILKTSTRFLREKAESGITVDLLMMGKKGDQFFARGSKGDITKNVLKIKGAPVQVMGSHYRVAERPEFSFADKVAKDFCGKFGENYDAVYAVYPEFRSALSQQPTIERILPILAPAAGTVTGSAGIPGNSALDGMSGGDYLVKPSEAQVIQELVTRQISNKVFRIMLNAAASEHGARMTAMDSATNNAREVIKKLTLQYNRGRQAAITTELIEITSGASAL